jgi:hypothetical protein
MHCYRSKPTKHRQEEPAPDAAVDDTMTDDAATPLDDETPVEGEPVKSMPTWSVPQSVKDMAAAYPEDETLNGNGAAMPTGIVYADPTATDLARWERKAIKGLKRFQHAAQPLRE